jgi:hypothetical protein
MARRSPDGETRLDFVATIANPNAPSAAALNAGVPITPHAVDWDFPETGSTVDTADMASSFNKQDAGTFGGDSGTINIYRDSTLANDDGWQSLTRLTRGFFVERLFGGTDTTYATGNKVSVYQGVVTARSMQGRTRNTPLQATLTVALTAEPIHDAAAVI